MTGWQRSNERFRAGVVAVILIPFVAAALMLIATIY